MDWCSVRTRVYCWDELTVPTYLYRGGVCWRNADTVSVCWSQLASQKNHATFPKLEFAGFYRILPVFYRIFVGFWVKLPSRLLKNTRGCFTMREEVAESYMLNGNGVQKELFLTQPNFLIMPKINLNLLRKLASLVTWVNSRWFLALKKNLASLKKSSFFYAASIQQILINLIVFRIWGTIPPF